MRPAANPLPTDAVRWPLRAVRMAVASLLFGLLGTPAARADLPHGSHPRFLLGRAGALLERAHREGRAPLGSLVSACEAATAKPIKAGYQGWDWANTMSACAIAWRATGEPRHAAAAVTYWKALLDDQSRIGDGAGGIGEGKDGKFIVCADSGYAMRTYGVYSALGLDWLHEAPGVDEALRQRVRRRLDLWGTWYEHGGPACRRAEGGYMKRVATSNYFSGYFLATWAAAIAVGADDPVIGGRLLERARRLTEELVRPALEGPLSGGDVPEGWQYGELMAASYAIASAAAVEQGFPDFAAKFMHDVIALHLYALQPGGARFFDSGDHQKHPVPPGTLSIHAALVLAPGDPFAPFAKHYVATVKEKPGWIEALADAVAIDVPSRPWADARMPLSYHAKGTGVVLARSGWGPSDTWVSLQAAGRLVPDHQHCDAGHIAVVRGSDDLLPSVANYNSWGTVNKNTLLIDDNAAVMPYSPNQGPWGRADRVRLRQVADLGLAVAAEADFADAYSFRGQKSSVSLARRTWIYLRPDVLVVSDRAVVSGPEVSVRYAVQSIAPPAIDGSVARITAGDSALAMRTLLPARTTFRIVEEPTQPPGRSPWMNESPWSKTAHRIEEVVAGPRASFLHVMRAGPVGTAAPAATVEPIGVSARLVRIKLERPALVVIPAAPDGAAVSLPLRYNVPPGSSSHVVAGIASGGDVRVSVASRRGRCAVTIAHRGSGLPLDARAGAIAFDIDGCRATRPN